MSNPAERDWYRRIPNDPGKDRKLFWLVVGYFASMATAMFLAWLLWDANRVVARVLNFVVLLGALLPLFRKTDEVKQALEKIEPIEHLPSDRAVNVQYKYKEWSLGTDSGFLGRRKEGVTFSGLQTIFSMQPEEISIKLVRNEYGHRHLLVSSTEWGSDYEIVVSTIGLAKSEDSLDAASELHALIFTDGPDLPPASVSCPPPMTASPAQRFSATSQSRLVYGIAIFMAVLVISGYIWWAINFSDDVNRTDLAGVLLVIVLFGLALSWPSEMFHQ